MTGPDSAVTSVLPSVVPSDWFRSDDGKPLNFTKSLPARAPKRTQAALLARIQMPTGCSRPRTACGGLSTRCMKSPCELFFSARARRIRSLLTTRGHPISRVRDSRRLAAFTVVPMTANSSRFNPMSPSTTGPKCNPRLNSIGGSPRFFRSRFSSPIEPSMACAQRKALPASESPVNGVPNVTINPSHHGPPRIGQRCGGKKDEEVNETVESELHGERPVHGAQGTGHDGEEGQQRQVAKHQEKLRPGPAGLADLQLRPTDGGENAEHQDVIDDVPVRIDDRQGHRRYRQRARTASRRPSRLLSAKAAAANFAVSCRTSVCPATRSPE